MLKEHRYSVLVVSASDKFVDALFPILSPDEFDRAEVATNVGQARRMCLESTYDIIVINTPLTDEFGANFAVDIASDSGSGVMLCVKADMYDEITAKTEDYGVLTVSKPTNRVIMKQSIKLLCATRERLMRIERKVQTFEEKMEEIKIVNKAKWLLIDNLKLGENEAHKYIEKLAMNTRKPRREVASHIIEEYSKPEGGKST